MFLKKRNNRDLLFRKSLLLGLLGVLIISFLLSSIFLLSLLEDNKRNNSIRVEDKEKISLKEEEIKFDSLEKDIEESSNLEKISHGLESPLEDYWEDKILEFEELFDEISTKNYGVDGFDYDSYDKTGAVYLNVGDKINDIVRSYPENITFILRSGTHRITKVIFPKDNQKFIGEPGAILSGAVLINYSNVSYNSGNGFYYLTGLNHTIPLSSLDGETPEDVCGSGYEDCAYPEDLYLDDVMLREVMSLGLLGQGKYYIDDNNSRVYFYDNPLGKKIEFSITPFAFIGGLDGDLYGGELGYYGIPSTNFTSSAIRNVSIIGLTIEKFASPFQYGAIMSYRFDAWGDKGSCTRNWIVEYNEIRLNHGVGLLFCHNSLIKGNHIHHNGQQGIAGAGDNATIRENEISFNHLNESGFSPEGGFTSIGGTKFSSTENLSVVSNYVHDNSHKGLWTDGSNKETLYEGNVVIGNEIYGIEHEISHYAIIRGNYIKGNSLNREPGYLRGSGMLIHNSDNVLIEENYVIDNGDGIGVRMSERNLGECCFDQLGMERDIKNVTIKRNYIRTSADSTGYSGKNGVVVSNFNDEWMNTAEQSRPLCNSGNRCDWFYLPRTFYLNTSNIIFEDNTYVYNIDNSTYSSASSEVRERMTKPFLWGDSNEQYNLSEWLDSYEIYNFEEDITNPSITLVQPSGSKSSRSNILLNYSVSDSNIQSCWFNVLRGGTFEFSNTTLSCSSNSYFFNVSVDANFTLTFYANDSSGNYNQSNINFSVSTSSGGGGSSGSSNSGSGSSSGGGGSGSSSGTTGFAVNNKVSVPDNENQEEENPNERTNSLLKKSEFIKFKDKNDKDYSVMLKNILDNKSVFYIEETKTTLIIGEGEEAEFDIDDDGEYDISIKIFSISEDSVEFSLNLPVEKESLQEEPNLSGGFFRISGIPILEYEEGKTKLTLQGAILIFIILTLIGYFIYRRIKKKRELK